MIDTPPEKPKRQVTQQQIDSLALQIGHLTITAAVHRHAGDEELEDAARVAGQSHLEYALTLLGLKPEGS
jgi:hypothetical protein